MENTISREGFDSTFLYNEMSKLEPGIMGKILNGLEFLNGNNINGVVIGGTAIAYYVEGRNLTPDIDVMVSDLGVIKDKLNCDNIKYTQLISFDGKPLGISIPDFELDILESSLGNKALNRYIIERSYRRSKIAGYDLNMILPEALCLMKFQTGRNKDDADAFMLIMAKVLNQEAYLNIIATLSGSLSDPDTLLRYAKLIK